MLDFKMLDRRYDQEALGFIPAFLVEADPRPAVDQINERYAHGGGWFDLKVGEPKGFRMIGADNYLLYPGDPPLHRIAEAVLHGDHVPGCNPPRETIAIYEHAFVAIIQPDGSFRVSRLD